MIVLVDVGPAAASGVAKETRTRAREPSESAGICRTDRAPSRDVT
jgi:hypothetical protein